MLDIIYWKGLSLKLFNSKVFYDNEFKLFRPVIVFFIIKHINK